MIKCENVGNSVDDGDDSDNDDDDDDDDCERMF